MPIDIIIDSREPSEIVTYLKKRFKDKATFKVNKLDEGDYETPHCLFERKKIGDLYSSILDGRIQSQCCRLALHDDKVIGLLIYGDLEAYKKEMRIKKKIFVNEKLMVSTVAEMACRYNLVVIWVEEQKLAYSTMIDFMEGVETGKWQVPLRCKDEILIARLLKISPKQYKELCKVCSTTSLTAIGKCSKPTIMRVKGIGEKKAEYIKQVLK